MSTLKIAGIVGDSITDGPGIRTAIFVQGCSHNCLGCHNPETHDFAGGSETTVEQLLEIIKRNPLLSGITLTGGDPMFQPAPLAELARQTKALGLEVACYTGFTFEELMAERDPDRMRLLDYTDVLVDGRFVLAERSLDLKFKGSRNQRILDVKKSLASGEAVLMHDGRWD